MTNRREFLKTGMAAGALALVIPSALRTPWPSRAASGKESGSELALSTYELTIDFVGMCLFVQPTGGSVRVLLPAAVGHVVYVYGQKWPENGVDVGRSDFLVPGEGEATPLKFMYGLQNFSSLWSGSKVPSGLAMGAKLDNGLSGRFTLTSGAVVDNQAAHGLWTLTNHTGDIELSPITSWKVTMPAGAEPLGRKINKTSWRPAAGEKIRVEVRHAIEEEQGKNPKCPTKLSKGDYAPHFPAYDQLFKPALTDNLRWSDVKPLPRGSQACDKGVSPFTCMNGGGDIGL